MPFQPQDYRFKGQAPMGAIMQAYQNKARQEYQMKMQAEQAKRAKTQDTLNIINQASSLVQKGVQMSTARQQKDARKTMAELMARAGEDVAIGQDPVTGDLINKRFGDTPQFQAQLKADFARAHPDEAAKEQAKALFALPKDPTAVSKQTKQVIIDGIPTLASWNPKTDKYSVRGKEVPASANIEPFDPNAVPDITDKHRKKYGALAKKMHEGKATASEMVRARGKEKTIINLVAADMYPDFDPTLVTQRKTMRKQYTPQGLPGKNIIAMNTAIGHANSLKHAVKGLNPKQIKLYNRTRNRALEEIGDPQVRRVRVIRDALADETARIYQGQGVVAQQAKEEMRDNFDMAGSKAQWDAALDATIELMSSRVIELDYGWKGTMGDVAPPMPFINSKNKKILEKMGYDPRTLEKTTKPRSGKSLGGGWSFEVR